MVSIKSILVIAFTAASVGSVQAFNAPEYRRIKLSGDNHYGNFTIYSGTGTAVSHTARPTLFSKHEHKYVTVTYTLGDGRAITKTITKTREFQHETPIPAPVWYVNPVITTVQVVDPLVTRVIKSAKKKGRKTSTTYTTVTRDPPCPGTIIEYPKPTHSYVPKELVHDVTNDPVFEHPEFAPKHPKFAPKHTAVTGITTATRFKVRYIRRFGY